MEEKYKRRFAPNISLDDFGIEAQQKLLDSSVLVIGAGALGATAAMYLAASGIGSMTIVDFDTVDISNLQRQVFYSECEAGKPKVELIAKSLSSLFGELKISTYKDFFNKRNASVMTEGVDLIIDAADNPATTYLIEETAEKQNLPYITAGVTGWKAQIFTHAPGGIHFSEIFPQPADSRNPLPCSIAGVFGPLTGMVASLEASEAIKILIGKGETLNNQLLTVNLFSNEFNSIELSNL